jgi:uncharacterized protein YwgA
MLSSDDVLFAIARACDRKVVGRTMIQKIGYFIGIKAGADLGYHPHYYGPYSPTVAATLEERVGCVHFRETPHQSAEAFVGHDGTRKYYEYELSDEGDKAAEIHRNWHPEEFDEAVEIAKEIQSLQANYMQLSFAAKVHCIAVQRSRPFTVTLADIQASAREFGWAMTKSDVAKGVEILEKLRLVTKRKRGQRA